MKIRLADQLDIVIQGEKQEQVVFDGQLQDVQAEQKLEGQKLRVRLRAETTPVKYLRLRWVFTEKEKRHEPVRVYGDAWERGYGDLCWQGIVPERCMPWVCAVSNGSDCCADVSGRMTECFGVMVRPSAFCLWQYDPEGITLWMDVRNGGNGVVLNGRTLDVCQVVWNDYTEASAFHALKHFYTLLCEDPLHLDAPVYGSNNWYYAYGKSSHQEILADTDFLVQHCSKNKCAPFMVIDDGWQPNACDGPWDQGNERFPDMKALADRIRARGARPGIWIRFLRDEKCETSGIKPDMRMMNNPDNLDPSHPAVLEKVAEDTRRLVKNWGYELIKHDFSTYDIFNAWGSERKGFMAEDGWNFFDRSKTTAEIIISFYQTIREATKGRALILGCNVIGHLGAGLIHINRTGDDTSGVEWERTRKMGVNTLAYRMLHHEAFYAADADCVGITGAIAWDLNREWMRALSVSATPLFVSCKPGILDERSSGELQRAFEENEKQNNELVPVDWMETVCPVRWKLNGKELTFHWFASNGCPLP